MIISRKDQYYTKHKNEGAVVWPTFEEQLDLYRGLG